MTIMYRSLGSAVACAIVLMAVPATGRAQWPAPSSTQVEVNVAGGFVNSTATGAITNATSRTSSAALQLSALRSARAGMRSVWHLGPVDADAGLSLETASAFSASATRSLGMLHLGTRRGPVSLSVGFEQSLAVGMHSRDTAITRFPGDTLGSSVGDKSDALMSSPNMVRAQDIVGALGWHGPLAQLKLLAGLRTNDHSGTPWLGATFGIGIGSSSALAISGHLQRSDATIRTPAFSVGFHTAYQLWGTGARPIPTDEARRAARAPHVVAYLALVRDSVRLHVYLPDAQHPVLMGDATEWNSVPMQRDMEGWWSVMLHLPDAVSRIQLRGEDGTWGPVPGLATTRDEYGGVASLLVRPTPTP